MKTSGQKGRKEQFPSLPVDSGHSRFPHQRLFSECQEMSVLAPWPSHPVGGAQGKLPHLQGLNSWRASSPPTSVEHRPHVSMWTQVWKVFQVVD